MEGKVDDVVAEEVVVVVVVCVADGMGIGRNVSEYSRNTEAAVINPAKASSPPFLSWTNSLMMAVGREVRLTFARRKSETRERPMPGMFLA